MGKQKALVELKGIVMGGSNIAQVLGFPTANISLTDPSLSGTYAGEVTIEGERYPAAVYADPKRLLLESHILDFNSDLYGKEIAVKLFKHIADPEDYPDEEASRRGIARAVEKVRTYFNK